VLSLEVARLKGQHVRELPHPPERPE
jgi:hypothetical protein